MSGGETARDDWPLYEVFLRGKRGLNHVHVGSLHAPDPQMALFYKTGPHGHLIASGGVAGVIHGNWTLLKWQFFAALFVIVWTAVITFIR